MGRPKLDNPRSSRFELRLLPDEIARWTLAAERAGQSLSAWVRVVLNREAAKVARAPKGKR